MSPSACSHRAWLATAVLVGTGGCEIDAPEFRFGTSLAGLEFNLFSQDAGIHPNDDIIGDPNNPFRESGIGLDNRFDVFATVGPIAGYYAFGTDLAFGPNGPSQFFVAQSLEAIFRGGLADSDQLPIVREMAIRAYQSVLDNFPDSFEFTDRTLTSFFRLATPSYEGIVRLGGVVQGDWVLVVNPDGFPVAVRGSNTLDPPRPSEAAEEALEEREEELQGGS